MMKSLLSFCMFSLVLSSVAQKPKFEIHFRKNIEFFGYLIELGDPSDNDPHHPISTIIHQYPENRDKKALKEIFGMGADIDYGIFISLMYNLPELPFDPNYQFPASKAAELGFESEMELNFIRALVQKVNAFYLDTNFEKIWSELEPFQDATVAHLAKFNPQDTFIGEIESFYGSAFAKYEIIPSLTIWSGPGWGGRNLDKNTARFVLGPIEKNYVFKKEGFQSLAIHEFGHAFVNHKVLPYDTELTYTEALFVPIAPHMSPQGYFDWKTCVIEHFVRAGEIIVLEQINHKTQSDKLLYDYRDNRKFMYLDFIVQKLKAYRVEKGLDYEKSVKAILVDLHDYYLKD